MGHAAASLFGASAPQVVLIVDILWILILAAASGGRAKQSAFLSAILGLLICGVTIASSWGRPIAFSSPSGPVIRLDNFALCFHAITVIGALICLVSSYECLRDEALSGRMSEFCALILLACVGSMYLVSATDLVILFLSIDTVSLSLYVLTGFASRRPYPTEAALKYLLLGALASAFLVYGVAFLYGAYGTTNLTGLTNPTASPVYAVIGLGLFLVGLFFKIAFVPFHQWAPDVYEGAISPVTAFMTTVPKVTALGAYFRFFPTALGAAHLSALSSDLLAVVSLLTMIVANLAALAQSGVKRMLAYSSIAHAGYMALSLFSGSRDASSALFFYSFSYTLMTAGAFAASQLVEEPGGRPASWQELTGLAYRHPLLGISIAVFMAGLTGIPFTAGFWAKVFVFKTAVEAHRMALVVVAVVATVVSAYYYLRVVWSLYETRFAPSQRQVRPWSLTQVAVALCALLVVLLGIVPSPVVDFGHQSGLLPD